MACRTTKESAGAGRVTACLLPGGLGLLGFAKRGRRWRGLVAVVMLAGISALSGCSGKYPAHTAPGVYTIVIEGRGEQSQLVHDELVTLAVTP